MTQLLIAITFAVITYAVYCTTVVTASLLWYWHHCSSERRKARDEAHRAQDNTADAQLRMCCELAKPKRCWDRAFWEQWADEHELPQSTRITLFAGMGEKR